jgi:hypothetical protein
MNIAGLSHIQNYPFKATNSPFSAIIIKNAPVAQWIEQETSKLLAVGSIPTRGTISMVHRNYFDMMKL